MTLIEILLGAPFCVAGLLLYSFMATFEGISTKTWFMPLLMASCAFWAVVLVKSFSGEIQVENGPFILLVFSGAMLVIALSLDQFKKTHRLTGINAVSFVLSAVSLVLLYQDYGLLMSPICVGLAVMLELVVWFFIARNKVKILNPETGSVLLLVGNVATAVMIISFYIYLFTSGVVQAPASMNIVNAMCAAFLCRFLLTHVYLCVRTIYRARRS